VTAAKVEVDTRALVAGVRKLAAGVVDAAPTTARKAAETVATNIRSGLPVRTGRLAGSVAVVTDPEGGYGVSYGAGVSYARPVAARTGAVGAGIAGVPDEFARDCKTVAERQISRL
jgi:hypothetical protein